MNYTGIKPFITKNIVFLCLFCISAGLSGQSVYRYPEYRVPRMNFAPPYAISFGIHFDPVISWFTTDNCNTHSEGAILGYNFGISYNRYFGPYYSFSSGVNIIDGGGRLIYRETTCLQLNNYRRETVTVEAGESIIYRIKYFCIPFGLKLQTKETGYRRLFVDIGLDPKIVISGRADIPSLNIRDNNALPEIRAFNLSYHIIAGIEYPITGNLSAVFGLGFDNNFLDTTRDNKNEQWDMVNHKLLSFRLGINF